MDAYFNFITQNIIPAISGIVVGLILNELFKYYQSNTINIMPYNSLNIDDSNIISIISVLLDKNFRNIHVYSFKIKGLYKFNITNENLNIDLVIVHKNNFTYVIGIPDCPYDLGLTSLKMTYIKIDSKHNSIKTKIFNRDQKIKEWLKKNL